MRRSGIPLMCALLYTPLILKALYVEKFIYKRSMQLGVGSAQVFARDAMIYLVLTALFTLSFTAPRLGRWSRLSFRAFWSLGLIVYAADVLVIKMFNTHIVLNDVMKYLSYTPQYLAELSQASVVGSALSALLILALLGGLLFTLVAIESRQSPRLRLVALTFCISALSLKLSVAESHYVHSWIYQDLISYNRVVYSESVDYSDTFKRELGSTLSHDEIACQAHKARTPSIILLMVESLSAYQSAHFSGIKDWTPELDSIARRHVALTQFYANGFTTEDGEISLLTGLVPLYRPASFTRGGGASFRGFFGVKDSLPRILKSHGYDTSFLTTSDLSFSNTRAWAESLGFDLIEGHESPDYEAWPRFQFKAAPDEALFQRIIRHVDERARVAQPSFVFSKTVTSHHPFVNPETGVKSEAQTVRYVDRQIGALYKALESRDFFKNGVLIIVGDHHSMIPVRRQEVERWGAHRATARIPAVIVSQQHLELSHDQPLQQTDLFQGLVNLTSPQRCVSPWRGDAVSIPPHYPRWIIHRRGDMRNQVSVFSTAQDHLIELNGDDTRHLNPEGTSSDREVLNRVNLLRISHHERGL